MLETGENKNIYTSKMSYEREHLLALKQMLILETYYRWSYDLFKSHLGRRILDAGCGLGNFSAIAEKDAEYVLCVDLSKENIRVLKQRFKDSNVVEIAQADLETNNELYRDKQFDTIVCLDVLEHVLDDVALLRRFFKIIRTGGHLLVKVPACPWLFGSVDVASGHVRRYTPNELRIKAESTGWEAISVDYMNIAGVIPYWVKSCVLKKRANFSRTFMPWQLKVIRWLVPALKILDKTTGAPIGQSATLIARKPSKKTSP